MVADDEAVIRKVLFDLLTGAGFKVTLARDGMESLERMAHHCFDLLITDVNMPRLDGLGLLRQMKKDGRTVGTGGLGPSPCGNREKEKGNEQADHGRA